MCEYNLLHALTARRKDREHSQIVLAVVPGLPRVLVLAERGDAVEPLAWADVGHVNA